MTGVSEVGAHTTKQKPGGAQLGKPHPEGCGFLAYGRRSEGLVKFHVKNKLDFTGQLWRRKLDYEFQHELRF